MERHHFEISTADGVRVAEADINKQSSDKNVYCILDSMLGRLGEDDDDVVVAAAGADDDVVAPGLNIISCQTSKSWKAVVI